ncbi:aspartate/glutamate racemase family protein [Pseudooceanicola sp.]|uniref:aspartate/glutamate racemase family protein n=1 Tax=Pseudooceanicola sp. TaxID=1914328 RepID=UPI00262892B4|nr:aspartate/glutamate racemase family protein [Pseudooceanicola sp.]MDF1856068.1 aspartate/glutamate racemase family protein [Pseudooceanicola sp.]
MRLLLLNGNTTTAMTDLCAVTARRVARTGTEIVPLTASEGSAVITTRTENALAEGPLLELLAKHGDGAEGVLVAVSFDTALAPLREAARVPVVGMTEAALHVAALLGGPIGFVGPGLRARNIYRDVIIQSGLSDRVTGIATLDLTPEEYLSPEATCDRIVAAAQTQIAEGAESIVLAGAAMAGMQQAVQEALPVPVVEGIAAAVVLLEGLVDLAPRKPETGSYARLPPRDVTQRSHALAGLFRPGPR